MIKIGIIGGSGLDDPDILRDPQMVEIDTEYGKPSSSLMTGKIGGIETCFWQGMVENISTVRPRSIIEPISWHLNWPGLAI